MNSSSPLFAPFEIPGLKLDNRIVMAPMTREFSPDGIPGPDVAAYYARRAAGGAGLVITEATDIDHPASWGGRPRVPRFFGADAMAGWAEVARAVHAEGARIVPQLWHIGAELAVSGTLDPTQLVSPSGIATDGTTIGEPMTETQIAEVVASFGRAASSARAAGFDGIELNAGHGFLIDQFFWDRTNRRADGYGGDLVARTRFACEVIAECRRATAPDFPIILRISQWKIMDFDAQLAATPDELERFLAPLVQAGVDLFHCSTRRFWTPEFEGSELPLATWVRKLSGKPTITVGSVGLANSDFMTFAFERKGAEASGPECLETRLARDDFDLVAVGRALLADPLWPEKVRAGKFDDLVSFQAEMADTLF
jgi:2,4-dienoyl-CoA reductase-like NADH-dependent reductase (Old Yellow Enzyme family)